MPEFDAIRRGISNEGGFFSPYYLFDLMAREHRAELDFDGRERERRQLPRVFRKAAARLEDGAPLGALWPAWYGELFQALGLETQAIADGFETPRHGLVPVSHLAIGPGGVPLALLDAHRLGVDLDRDPYPAEGHDRERVTREPIARGFEMALDAQETRWGLLTNGHEIRLYRKGASISRQYLCVDFANLFDADRDDEWTAFWGLFRARAFIRGEEGKCLLDRVLEGSQRHASRIAEDLRNNVVTALEALVQGVLDERENFSLWGGERPDARALARLFEESLHFLYRLLFILYAESRDVLPVAESPVYRDTYSLEHLRALAEREAAAEDAGKRYYIESIRTLFRLLRKGYKSAELEIPALGGRGPEDPDWESVRSEGDPHLVGLFDGRRTLWLDRCRIPDAAVRTVVRELSLSRPKRRKEQRQRYSYADLGVDQLGSIYEGLLAYEPAILSEETVLAKLSGELRLVTRAQAEESGLDVLEESLRRPGQFVLRLWGGRRKGSGSYYTPHELTAFLVQAALAPRVEEIVARCEAAGIAERNWAEGEARRTGTLALPGARTRIAEEILDLRVCDPAMGSGAFLIQACRYLGESYGRARIAEGRDESGRIEPAELLHFKRLVAERSLYGVDLNPLAVELAKVSIWLETLARGRPLSFLDSHLRCGNSLVGAPMRDASGRLDADGIAEIPSEALKIASHHALPSRIAESKELVKRNNAFRRKRRSERGARHEQTTFFELDRAALRRTLDGYLAVRREIDASGEEAPEAGAYARREEQEERFRTAYEGPSSPVRRLREICDLWCAAWFWPEERKERPFGSEEFQLAAAALLAEQTIEDAWIATAREVAATERFFHWELEFPEVFLRENPGFDACFGNPPWEKVSGDEGELAGEFDPLLKTLRGAVRDERLAELLEEPAAGAAIRVTARRRSQYARFAREGPLFDGLVAGELNTFAPFAVLAWRMHRAGGSLAMVLKDAFHLTESAGALRSEILSHGAIELLATADNERKVFDAHHLLRFDVVLARRGEPRETVPISVHRFRSAQEIVDHARECVDVPVDLLRDEDGRPTAPIPEIVDPAWPRLFAKVRRMASPVEWGRELDSSVDKEVWTRDGRPDDSPGPVLALVGPFDALEYEPMACLLPDAMTSGAIRKVLWGRWRVAVRDRVNQKDERVLIGAVVPPHAATCDYLKVCKEPAGEPQAVLLLAALANSLVLDALARPFVGIHMSSGILNKLPWALALEHPATEAIVRDVAALTCAREEFGPLADELGVERTGLQTPQDRELRRARIDASVARLYDLTAEELALLLASFRLLDQDQPPLHEEPKSFLTRDLVLLEFCRLTDVSPPRDVVAFYAKAGADIALLTGPIRDLEQRVDEAQRVGAIAYVPARKRERDSEGE